MRLQAVWRQDMPGCQLLFQERVPKFMPVICTPHLRYI